MYIGTVHVATITHNKRLVRPDTGGSDRLFKQDYPEGQDK